MEQILPNKLTNLEKELRKINRLECITNTIMIIVGISVMIAIWTTLNQRMSNQAWQEGYERGYEQSQWDTIDREINSKDYGTIKMMPETDAEIWETYHDCNMYGLPEYARPICEGKVQES